jgi:ABC-type proline/glycine betaine transport system permease subunit
MEQNNKPKVEFYGTSLFALIPLLIFIVGCILFFVVFKTYDMMNLCMGGFVALIIGSFFSKNWGNYWQSVVKGLTSPVICELICILLVVGMFGKR